MTPGLRAQLSPHAAGIDAALRLDARVAVARPLSIAPAATRKALGVALLTIGLFWIARETFARGGIRRTVRVVAWAGLAVSVAATIARAVAPGRLYGLWDPGVGTITFGPFVNRNHMGTWLVMALPLVGGYTAARAASVDLRPGRLAAILDATQIWLIGSVGAMFMATIVSLSRSAFIGLIAAAVCAGVLSARRRGAIAAAWILAIVVAGGLIAVAVPKTGLLMARFERPDTEAEWSRPEIWRETLPIVADFALTGTGVGTYGTAMLVYQTADRRLFFNQAHNQYLQLAAEGGLLLIVPLGVAAIAWTAAVRRQLRQDRTPVFWIRLGAVAGIAGVLTQSVWETGLRLPANALLFATICALAVHTPRSDA
jgi:O-antigen ligase